LYTDYCGDSVSAVLEQQGKDGRDHPVAYASKTCTAAECKYGSTDGELLALYFGVTKFHNYVAGSVFTIVTDHQALLHLETARGSNPRLARYALKLANYDYKVRYRQGCTHGNADGLTRAPASP
jgi:RNase H-like domain found in reverse transcriptase